jgi:putative solute:sodium symporter small subunit
VNAAAATPPAAARVESPYWRHTRRLTAWLLVLWFVVTTAASVFAREIDFQLFGWPFSFWFGSQGALLLYLLVVGLCIWRMERLEDGTAPEDG